LRQQRARELAEGLKAFEKEIGVGPGDIERATVVMSDFRSRGPLVFITTSQPYDRAKILAGFPGVKAEKRQDQIFFVSDKNQAVVFLNDRTYLIGPAEGVRAYLDRPAAREGPLSAALQLASQKHQIVGGLNIAAFAREVGDKLPPEMEAFKDLLKARSATWTVDLAQQSKADVRLEFGNQAEAKRAEKPLRAAIDLARAVLAQGIQAPTRKPENGINITDMLRLVDAALHSASIEQKGQHLQVLLSIKTDVPTVVASLVEGVQKVRHSANRAQSMNNLKQIALAMHNYHDAYGHFPPQAVYSKDGKPLLSWRVLLLPFLEQDSVYRQFKLDEAWDGPHNSKLLVQMPKVYADPAVDSKEHQTVYQGFFGPGAFFEGEKGLRIADITDGTSNTVMVVEAVNLVPWSKPEDLPYLPNGPLPKLGGHRSGGFNAAFCDGSVRFLKQNIKESVLRALITRNGGEVIDPNEF
jgi:prepilin-type processing-associated H-X9-DG protein